MSDKFIYLKTDMTVEVVEIPLECRLSKFYELVGCDCFEIVALQDFGDLLMVVDEYGKLYDEPKPVNLLASALYPGSVHGDLIVGDVLIGKYGFINDEPDIVGLYDPAILHFTNIFNNLKEIYINGKRN